MKTRIGLLLVVLLALTSTEANAELVAYDGFAYEAGAGLKGRDGGFGFAGPWRTGGFNAGLNENYEVSGGSLEFAGLSVAGNRSVTRAVSSIAGLTRDLAEPLGEAGTTRYLSFLVRPEGQLGEGAFNGFFGVLLEQAGEPEMFAGKPGDGQMNRYVLENRGGTAAVATDTEVELDRTVLIVLKSEFADGPDTFTLFMNPPPGGMEPENADAVRTASLDLVQGLTIYSTGAFSLDEIRLGESFADVVPVPEPPPSEIVAMEPPTANAYVLPRSVRCSNPQPNCVSRCRRGSVRHSRFGRCLRRSRRR